MGDYVHVYKNEQVGFCPGGGGGGGGGGLSYTLSNMAFDWLIKTEYFVIFRQQ